MNKKNLKKDLKSKNEITLFHIAVAIPIVLIDALIKPFKKCKGVLHTPEHKAHTKPRIPILLKKRMAFAYLFIAALLTLGGIYALLSDRVTAETSIQAGTVLVRLDEDSPFDDLGSVNIEGAATNEKTFRAVSICTLDTYVRARIIPVVEKYDAEEECYVVIPIDINSVNLSITSPYWTYSNGYYYYGKILEPDANSSDVEVVVSIGDSGEYEDTNIRVTLRVELEAAQVRNDLWKKVFNIETWPV